MVFSHSVEKVRADTGYPCEMVPIMAQKTHQNPERGTHGRPNRPTMLCRGLVVAMTMVAAVSGGCAARPAPVVVTANLRSPYPENKVWAVAPLSNDSGVSVIDTLALTDQIVDEVSKIRGVDVLPLNRTLDGMRAMNLARVSSTDEALTLARTLNVDGLIVGNISAFDPYSPPKLGMTLQLFSPEPRGLTNTTVDIGALESAAREMPLAGLTVYRQPVAGASEIVDAQDNDVVVHLQQYAMGRSNPSTSLGWRRYLVDMDLYTHYVAYRLLDRMLEQERERITFRASAAGAGDGSRN